MPEFDAAKMDKAAKEADAELDQNGLENVRSL